MSNILNPREAAIKSNPANAPEKVKTARTRIPMSLPVLRLATPELPGYKLRWMRNEAHRIQQALAAGYEFVDQDELQVNTYGVASGPEDNGSTDLGTRISVSAGPETVAGQPERLFLMKIKDEFWDEDEKAVFDQQDKIAGTLRGDKGLTESGMDSSERYSRGEQRNIFRVKR